ncbi:MAG: GPW/gp25 family protein [Acidimicrobiales bacterium]
MSEHRSAAFAGVRGTGFPFRIDPATGGVVMSEGEAKIRENVRIIIGTRIGERPMLRDFGTRIPGLVQDPNDDVLVDIAGRQTVEALLRWESRIVVNATTVERDPDSGVFQLRLSYLHTNEQVTGTAIVPIA